MIRTKNFLLFLLFYFLAIPLETFCNACEEHQEEDNNQKETNNTLPPERTPSPHQTDVSFKEPERPTVKRKTAEPEHTQVNSLETIKVKNISSEHFSDQKIKNEKEQ